MVLYQISMKTKTEFCSSQWKTFEKCLAVCCGDRLNIFVNSYADKTEALRKKFKLHYVIIDGCLSFKQIHDFSRVRLPDSDLIYNTLVESADDIIASTDAIVPSNIEKSVKTIMKQAKATWNFEKRVWDHIFMTYMNLGININDDELKIVMDQCCYGFNRYLDSMYK